MAFAVSTLSSSSILPSMSALPHRLLIVEDDAGLAELLSDALSSEGRQCATVGTGGECREWLTSHEIDLLVLDFSLPDMTGAAVIAELRAVGRLPPFVITTGHGDEELAVELMKLGARDYFVKDARLLKRLPGAIARVLQEVATEQRLAAAEGELRRNEARYRALFNQSGDHILLLELCGDGGPRILDINEAGLRIHGYTREEVIGQPLTLLDPEMKPEQVADRLRLLRQKREHTFEVQHRRKDGSTFDVEVRSTLVEIDGRDVALCIEHDITGRKRDEAALRARNEELTRFNRVAVGRELRMIELKRVVNELGRQLGLPPRYALEFAAARTDNGLAAPPRRTFP